MVALVLGYGCLTIINRIDGVVVCCFRIVCCLLLDICQVITFEVFFPTLF